MLDSPVEEIIETDTSVGEIPDYLTYGLDTESASPPLPTADPAPDAGAAAQEPAPVESKDVDSSATGDASTAGDQTLSAPDPKVEATDAQGKPTDEADPELTEEQNKLANSLPEAERAVLKQTIKAAKFEDHFTHPNKDKAEVAEYLEKRFPSDYQQFVPTVAVRAIQKDVTGFLKSTFEKDEEAYGQMMLAGFKADPAYFLKQATGRDVTPEQLTAALDRELNGIPGAGELTDEMVEDIREFVPEAAEVLDAARKRASEQPAAKPSEPVEEKEAIAPEKVIEQYKADRQAWSQTWDAGIAPVQTFVEKKLNDRLGQPPTDQERTLAPLVATLKDIKRSLFLKGQGDALPEFETGLGKWGEHRKLGKNGEKDFDAALARINGYVEKKETEGAALAAGELIPFADLYFDERLTHPIFQQLDQLIEIAKQQANPPVHKENIIPGSAPQQPSSSTPDSLDDYLVGQAVGNR